MSDVLIIGCGVVGNNLLKELSVLTPDVVDKYKKEKTTKKKEKYKFGFVCVDTPYDKEKELFDTSEVVNAIRENDCEIYVIKSTVPIGFVNSLGKENIVFSPEYYGGTQHCNNFKFDFTILGGCEKTCNKVIQLLQKVYDARHRFLKIVSLLQKFRSAILFLKCAKYIIVLMKALERALSSMSVAELPTRLFMKINRTGTVTA